MREFREEKASNNAEVHHRAALLTSPFTAAAEGSSSLWAHVSCQPAGGPFQPSAQHAIRKTLKFGNYIFSPGTTWGSQLCPQRPRPGLRLPPPPQRPTPPPHRGRPPTPGLALRFPAPSRTPQPPPVLAAAKLTLQLLHGPQVARARGKPPYTPRGLRSSILAGSRPPLPLGANMAAGWLPCGARHGAAVSWSIPEMLC